MENLTYEIKTLIHHVIHRHNIYKMEIKQLRQVLDVLSKTSNESPIDIQHQIFQGIIQFHQKYKDNISKVLNQQKFKDISFDVKSIMHKVLHQYYFLHSIKAWEMFMPQYQQPGINNNGAHHLAEHQLLDDQLEKAKLHYLYYGPLSVYHFNQQMPPQPSFVDNFPPPPSQQLQMPQPFDYGRTQRKTDSEPVISRPRGRPPKIAKPIMQNQSPSKLKVKSQSFRPLLPSYKDKKIPQKMGTKEFLAQNKKLLQSKMDIQTLQNPFQKCLCGGQASSDKVFECKCSKLFHSSCVNNNKECLACRQAQFDPFIKVSNLISSFNLNWDKADHFQEDVNFISAWNSVKLKNYEILVSCACPSFQGVTWPDDVVFKINGEPVFQILALLQAHQFKKRKDRAMIITPYIECFANANPSYLQRIKLSLEVKNADGQHHRSNRKGIFQLCVFLAKELSPPELVKQIIEENCQIPNMNPFQWCFYGQVEVDPISITFYDTFSGQIMDHPVRGIGCKHYQCFDMKNFLQLTFASSARQWKCPYCHKDARKLLIDKKQLQLIEELKKSDLFPKKIIFYRSGKMDYQYNQTAELQQEKIQQD